uniref:Uncharacterized protein n=1 Tax=Arundo donax TaxID=35708 RepID=A0A0A9HQY3_ARUDO
MAFRAWLELHYPKCNDQILNKNYTTAFSFRTKPACIDRKDPPTPLVNQTRNAASGSLSNPLKLISFTGLECGGNCDIESNRWTCTTSKGSHSPDYAVRNPTEEQHDYHLTELNKGSRRPAAREAFGLLAFRRALCART